jgi:SAM-dependent methyltransferase
MSGPDTLDPRRATAEYYEANAGAFDARTRHRNMTAEYDAFLALVPKGGRILDAGCGAGRDALAFSQLGYRVTAIDASAAMVALASERLGFPALRIPFNDVDYEGEFDAVWACASLLHVSKADMPGVLERLRRALKPAGVFYGSVKRGPREEFREGRWFNDYEEEGLAVLFQDAGWKLLRVWPTEEARPDKHVSWVNVLALRSAA